MPRPRPVIYRVLEAIAGDHRLKASDRLVLIVLAKYADQDGNNCTACNATIARALCISKRQVERSVSKLANLGFVTRRRRRWDSAVTAVTAPGEPTLVADLEPQEPTSVAGPEPQEPTPLPLSTDTQAAQHRHPGRCTGPITDPVTGEDTYRLVPEGRGPEPEVVVSFPVNGKGPREWQLTRDYLEELVAAFPGVDVEAEARKARGWCVANLTRRKTARGMRRFLYSWMERANNSGGPARATLQNRSRRMPDFDETEFMAAVERGEVEIS